MADFAEEFDKELLEITQYTNKVVGMFAIDILIYLIQHSPVDTSKLISNWQLRLDEPAKNEIEAYYLGEKGSTERQSESEAIGKAISVLQYKDLGDEIYITNNAEYIDKLRGYGFIPEDIILDAISYAEAQFKERE